MSHVVLGSCHGCKSTDCVEVCPVGSDGCFREGPEALYIDPGVCIDCGNCVTECPVDAIRPDDDLSAEDAKYIQINIDGVKKYPPIEKKQPALKTPCDGEK